MLDSLTPFIPSPRNGEGKGKNNGVSILNIIKHPF